MLMKSFKRIIYKQLNIHHDYKVGKFILSVLVCCVVLSVFVMFYSYAGIHLNNDKKSTDYKWRPNELKTTMTEGFCWLRMDQNGFNNAIISADIDALIIGSSHMEAVQMRHGENVSGRLNSILPLKTYNIGMSGHTIYRCVDNYKSAVEEFNPKKYSVLETSTVKLSVSEMSSVIEGSSNRIPSFDSGIIYYLQLIPAFRAIFNQLENWISLDRPAKVAEQIDILNTMETSYEMQALSMPELAMRASSRVG